MKSKDRFQICIAPQRNLLFDRDIESEKLTFDFSKIKIAERVGKLNEFRNSLRTKLDEFYTKAYVGDNARNYQGSNLWQFFNDYLPLMTSKNYKTNLFVLTDGYFDFEDGNPKLSIGSKSTSTNFIAQIRSNDDWKEAIENKGYGISPISGQLVNVSVCVAGIRSKNENNLSEPEMLQFIWLRWLKELGINEKRCKTLLHTGISVTGNQIESFLSI